MSIIKTCVSEKKKKTLRRKTEKMDAPHFGARRTEVSFLEPLYEECHVQMELKGPRCPASLQADPPGNGNAE